MYNLGFGNIFHPETNGFTCRDIPRNLEYNNRKLVHHNHQGRRVKKKNGRLILFRGFEIDGKKIKQPRIGFLEKKTTSIIPQTTTEITIHEECLPSFPAWKSQENNFVEKIRKSSGFSTNLSEIRTQWKEWTRESAVAYLTNKPLKTPSIVSKSSWGHQVAQNTQKISDQLRLNNKITTMFFKKYRDQCLIDCSFLLSENGRSVAELEKQLKDFVRDTKKVLSFEWPMAVANLMLDEGPTWIPLFVTSQSHTVFNAVAATMARLLYDVIKENIYRVKTFFDTDDRAKLIIILHEGEEEFDYWQKINVLLELCKIPRVDHKIYPRMFTEAWIDVRNWFDSESIVFRPLPQPFESVCAKISKISETLDRYAKNSEDFQFWETIAKEVLDIREKILKQQTRLLKEFIIYDSTEIKKRSLERTNILEHRTKSLILSFLATKNNEIRTVFTKCSAKLFRNDVLVQLRNIEEVQNELPNIKQKILIVGNAYKTFMEYFTMPDYDIRQYYEISRLGMKLDQLVNFVWDRINHERQWITKQVSEQTSKNYYECEMIEKEWLDCLKKYRSAVRINEVQKVQIKMANLEERSSILKGKDEKLIGQRSLLGLPSVPIDCVRISNVCEFFSKLSLVHFKILLHHESCLRMRISEVNHNFLVAETERLQIEKDALAEQATAINEHVTTSKEALNKMQNMLNEFEKLLPVLGAISCQAMKDRHWQQILQGTETSLKVEGNPLVSELLEMNFIEKSDKFEEVGALAEKERILETSIDKMREQWKSATFVTHHGGELLTTELNVQMQAHLARSQTIMSSPHAFSILDHIRHWLETLLSLNTFVQLYKQCDLRWRKIEGVFSTEDIAYQMPHEFRTFKKISLRWLNINNKISEERPILEQMDLVQHLNTELSELEVLFGKMENGFHAYLRKKRAVFPRLFSFSDELLLSLICDSREPANCKSYLPLLFPALTTFDQNTKMEIVSVSTKFEILQLVKPVNVNLSKRHVEKWMHELDVQIKYTIKTRIRQMIEKLNYKMSPVESVLSENVQVAVVYLKIAFTWQMENSMKQNTLTILASELKICLRECQHVIIQKLERRQFLPQLYHFYKWSSNLVNKFINEQVIFIDDHRWTSQLRYYWHMESVFIRVGTVSTRYDYEIQCVEFILDQKAIDDAVKYFIYMNHFGFNVKTPTVDIHLARQIAGTLGRPFSICDSGNETDCKMLIEGSLLFGGLICIFGNNQEKENIGANVERDIYSAHNLSSLKYYFNSEITISNSCMFLLTSAFQTARMISLQSTTNIRTVDELFSLHSIAQREKKVQKLQIFTELENYFGVRNISRNYLEDTLEQFFDREVLEPEQAIESVILKRLSCSLNEKNRKLLKNLLQLTSSTAKKTPTPTEPPKSSETTLVRKDRDPKYIKDKTEELLELLQTHQVVVVFGETRTGKSEIIRRAAELKSSELQFEFGLWEDIKAYRDSQKPNQKGNKIIVIDGFSDFLTNQWLERINGEFAIFPWNGLPIITSCERVIIETDIISGSFNFLPMVLLESSDELNKKTTLEETEKCRIEEVFNHFTEFKYKKLEVIRKIEGLKITLNATSDRITDYLLITSLLTFSPLNEVSPFFFKKDESLNEFFQYVPYSNGWYTLKEPTEQKNSHFYIIRTINLILYSNFIPLLVCPPSQEFFEFLGKLQTDLDGLGWHTITMCIDKKMTIEEIKEFVATCSIMFGGHEVSEVDDELEGSNFFLIRGIEDASSNVIDWLRHQYERKKIMKMIFVTPYSCETFPKRIQRFLFQINWMDINGEKSLTLFPFYNYKVTLENLTKPLKSLKSKELVQNQLISALQDAQVLSLYEKVVTEFKIIRETGFEDYSEQCSVYKNTIQEIKDSQKRIRTDSIHISPTESKTISLIEKLTKINYGHSVLVGNDNEKSIDALMISAERNNQILFTNTCIKSVEEWRDHMNRLLRDCLIDGKETVLGLKISPSISSVNEAIMDDITCICCYKMIPPRYLTRLMLSEFGEKHTLEGKGIWEMLESKLAALKITLLLKADDFSWFTNCHRMLLSMIILIWWGEPSKQEQEKEMYDEVLNSELFTKQQIDQIIEVVEQLSQLKFITSRAEKLKIISTIVKLATKRKKHVKKIMTKYEKGMEKMKRAEEQVAGMQGELLRLQPQLVRTSIETSMLMSTIEKETIDVENAREVVAANEYKANEAATKAQSLKAESEAELASAIPALESAVEALETMTQSDVSSLKTMRFPPYAVRLCMEAVCILLGVKPAKITNEVGEVISDYWVSGQKLLSDIHFLAKIRSFGRDNISKKTMKLIREKYLSKEEFDPENVKQCSLAAEGLCRWVLAIDMYNQISKFVEPKRERLRKAEILVKQHLKQLEVKRKALLKVTEKLQGLSDQFSQMCQKKQELESQIASCEVRMERAERLVQALSGEKDKWKKKITDIIHEDSLSVPYSVGSTLALRIFGKLPIDEREKELRKTMRSLFPKLEVNIPCDMKSLVELVDEPICFVNDSGRAFQLLNNQFEKVVITSQWTEEERQLCLTPGSVLLFECCAENEEVARDVEQAEFYSQESDELIIMKIGDAHYEVNKLFRIFIRTSQNSINGLNKSVIIDNKFKDEELRRDICERMGLSNWFETLSHYNEMIKSRDSDVDMMEKTENEMLDLLGRSRDLDDERAIDLLAEARNLQASVTARNNEIIEMEQSLRTIEQKMSNCIDYAMKVIKLCYSLRYLDPFYETPLKILVAVLETKLIENMANINFKEIAHKISELYWNSLIHVLSWRDQLIFHHLLFHDFKYNVEKIDIKYRINLDCFHSFSTFILKTDSRKLILLKYDREVYATILNFGQVTRNANWKVFSILDHVILRLEKLTDEPIWLLLNLNKGDQKTMGKLKIIKEKLKQLSVVHLSFRLVVAYSDEIKCVEEIISLADCRFYFSASAGISQQIIRILANLSIRTFLDKSEESQRIQIIRMLSFHYGINIRRSFDPEFTVTVDDADLLAMLKLYQELKNLSDQPNEDQDVMKVKMNVIEPIYCSKTDCIVEKGIIVAMAQWIIEANLSIPTDTLLRTVIKEKQNDYEDFAHFMQSHDDSILCGLNARISREYRSKNDRGLVRRMKRLFETTVSKVEKDIPRTIEIKSWRMQIENGQRELDGKEVNNLTEIVTILKLKFCLKYKIQVSDVVVTGDFINEHYDVHKKEFEESLMLKISNCSLISANLIQGEIKESQTSQNQYVCILLKTSKKAGASNPRSLPLICPSNKKSVALIPFHSQFPLAHWQLRGVFVTSGRLNASKTGN